MKKYFETLELAKLHCQICEMYHLGTFFPSDMVIRYDCNILRTSDLSVKISRMARKVKRGPSSSVLWLENS